MKHTYLLIASLLSSPAPYWTYLKSPQKNFRRWVYNFILKNKILDPSPSTCGYLVVVIYSTKWWIVVSRCLRNDFQSYKTGERRHCCRQLSGRLHCRYCYYTYLYSWLCSSNITRCGEQFPERRKWLRHGQPCLIVYWTVQRSLGHLLMSHSGRFILSVNQMVWSVINTPLTDSRLVTLFPTVT